MDKKIFIINGSGGVGKDLFVKLVSEELNDIEKRFNTVWNYSSVDKVKEIAKQIGWNGQKEERDRKFLSDLKVLCSDYCDMPFNDMRNKVEEFKKDDSSIFLFLHIREPEEIRRAVEEFNARTVLIKRSSVQHITSNMADANVFNYKYDYVIDNYGTLDNFRELAKYFIKGELNNG